MTPSQEAVEIPAGIKNPFRWIPIGTKVEKVDFTGIQLDILKWHKEQMAKSNEWWNKKLSQELQKAESRQKSDSTAFCDCGDALERTGLYPGEATYYCLGCDETYV